MAVAHQVDLAHVARVARFTESESGGVGLGRTAAEHFGEGRRVHDEGGGEPAGGQAAEPVRARRPGRDHRVLLRHGSGLADRRAAAAGDGATVSYEDRKLSPALRTSQTGAPLAYQIEVRSGSETQQSLRGQIGRGRFSARIQTPQGESAREYIVADGALILVEDGVLDRMSIGYRKFVRDHPELFEGADAMYRFGSQGSISGGSDGSVFVAGQGDVMGGAGEYDLVIVKLRSAE